MQITEHLNNFNFSVYRLSLEAEERIELPRFNKGITLRGAFGTVFRRLVCHDLKEACPSCPLREACPYCAVFNPVVPPNAERLRLNRDIPRPFVIKPPWNGGDVYQAGDSLNFDLVVVGKAQDFLPYFIVTFEELGRQGIGVRRGKYRLKRLDALNQDGSWQKIYDYGSRMVRPPDASLCPAQFSADEETFAKSLRIEFLTPVLLKEKGHWVKPEFGALMKRLRDRINALAYFYCGEALEMDFKEFGDRAEGVLTMSDDLHWVEEKRYSKHRNLKHILKGYVGGVEFEGKLGPFLPLLRLGELLHVGKATAFGQGWFRIEEIGR
jgi:CRISPR-associated endoribonuclease Cas6